MGSLAEPAGAGGRGTRPGVDTSGPHARAHVDAGRGAFMRAARHERAGYTPVWLMRQAGRILPEYRAVREQWTLLEITRQPELCAEVTLQPLRRMALDAAVLFADIMSPLVAVGVDLDIVDSVGPVIAAPIRDHAGLLVLRPLNAEQDMRHITETIRIVKGALGQGRAVVGFAGGPFTVASYLVEGRATRDFTRTKAMMYAAPELWHELMERLTVITTAYLVAQLGAGADAVQLFDSWVGALAPDDYARYVQPYTRRIFAALAGTGAPTIHFGTNTTALLGAMATDGASIVGVDWRVPLDDAWQRIGFDKGIQGNLDPGALFGTTATITGKVDDILRRAGGRAGHIFNLGHGLLPNTPLENVERLVDLVHERSA